MKVIGKKCVIWTAFSISIIFVLGDVSSAIAKQKTRTNSIGMEFVLIPAGNFYMGSCTESSDLKEENKKRAFLGQSRLSVPCPSGEGINNNANDDETPQHKVSISKAFYMGKYEVTVGQFKKFIAGAGRSDMLTDDFIKYNSHGDSAAVCNVSWHDAIAFIDWLNKKESGKRYRLPTEAEWEYACRAGSKTIYSFGNAESYLGQYAWYDQNAYYKNEKYAHAVGRKTPNDWGLYDMHGNVWEWVQDWYDSKYYSRSPSTDPTGPSTGSGRVDRGGGWDSSALGCRSAFRSISAPGSRYENIGFRLALSPGR